MKKILLILLALVLVTAFIANQFFPKNVYQGLQSLARNAADFEHKQIDIDGHTYHYLDNNNTDKPTVLMVHGFTADKDNWNLMSIPLSDDFHLIAIDLLGHGESSRRMDIDYRISTQVKRLHAFTKTLKLPKLHIVGNSMGGQIAAVYAAKHPNDVITATLFNCGGILSPKDSEMFKLLKKDPSKHPLIPRSSEDGDYLFDFVFSQAPISTSSIRAMIAENTSKHVKLYEKIFSDIGFTGFEPLTKELPQIKVPVMVAWGQDDRVLDVSSVQVIEAILPNARISILPNVGHMPMMEIPNQSAELFANFVEDNSGS